MTAITNIIHLNTIRGLASVINVGHRACIVGISEFQIEPASSRNGVPNQHVILL